MQPALDFSAPRGKYPIAMQPEHAGGAVRGRGEEQCEPNLKDDWDAWMEKATGGGDHKLDQRYTGATTDPPTLKELGISKIQSSTWQKLARCRNANLILPSAKALSRRQRAGNCVLLLSRHRDQSLKLKLFGSGEDCLITGKVRGGTNARPRGGPAAGPSSAY